MSLFDFVKHLLAPRPPAGPAERRKLLLDRRPDVIYAIGDVHGCHDLLCRLEDRIVADAEREEGETVLVRLGDYVDRGPQSAQVLDRIAAPDRLPLATISLAGNHEEIMLDFLEAPHADHRWLRFGGLETLASYGIHDLPARAGALETALRAGIPEEHRALLRNLPSLVAWPGICLVHAGIEAGTDLAAQRDRVLLWKRPSPDMEEGPLLVVHGHTPVETVDLRPFRVNVDTGAYSTGRLSAVKLTARGRTVLSVEGV